MGENLIKAASASEALRIASENDFAVVLIDVFMPELDGFELAAMIREHPRFQRTAIIFVSAIQLTDLDLLRGYAAGAVDYVPVPVVPDLCAPRSGQMPIRVCLGWLQQKRGLRLIELARDPAHRRLVDRISIGNNRQRIAFERSIRKHIHKDERDRFMPFGFRQRAQDAPLP